MSKDRGYGLIILILSIIVAVTYLVAFFAPFIGLAPRWQYWAIGIPVLLFMLLVLVISAWIGWTMLTTPPPAPLQTESPAATEPAEETRTTNNKSKK
jgi:hypothetical protein